MSTTFTLFCHVNGDPPDSVFPVKIDKKESVGILKDAIKEKKSNAFQGIDADQLTLWRVSIPGDNHQALANLNLKNDEQGVQMLSSLSRISVVFPDEPADG